MREQEIQVPVTIERSGHSLYRAKGFLPLKVEVIGSSWPELRKKLIVQIRRDLKRIAPTAWVTGRVWSKIVPGHYSIAIPPPPKKTDWKDPFPIVLDTFQITLDADHVCLLIPLLDLSVIAKGETIATELLEQQIMAAIDRFPERDNIEAIAHWLDRRRFKVRTLTIRREDEKEKKPDPLREATKQFRKNTTTLRTIAIDLSRSESGAQPERGARTESGARRESGAEIYEIDAQVDSIASRLLEESRPSLLLVGPPGIGKTALVHRLAYRLHREHASERHLWSTTGARIVSGMCGLGMWQQRVQKILQDLRQSDGILHVGGLVELMEAGKIQGQPGVASMLRTSIANGRIQVIAEMTPDQLAMVEREDPLLLRSFARIEFPSPSNEFVHRVLVAAGKDRFSDEAVVELQQLYRRFSTYSSLPASALRLMRTLQESVPQSQIISTGDVTRSFALQTGLPEFLLDDSKSMDFDHLRHELSSHVIGQDEPVDMVVNLLATFKARLARSDRPLASLLFIGPTGVGKTEMAKAVAQIMYNDKNRMIRIDMSEYATPWSAIRLIGRPGEGDGTLVSPIREQPFSVVLLDEFEKADPAVFELLLQLLGEGRLTDSLGRVADFRNAIIIMTSNLGVESFRAQGFGFADESTDFRQHFERELRRFVRPELLGRIDRLIPFQPLSPTIVRQIVQRELKAVAARPGLKDAGVQLFVEESAIDRLSEIGYIPRYGARPIGRAIEKEVVLPIALKMEQESITGLHSIRVAANNGRMEVLFERSKPEEIRIPEATIEFLNRCRELRLKAQLAIRSDEFRRLENEIERNRRQRILLERTLHVATKPRRQNLLREQLGMLDKASHEMLLQRNRVLELVESITNLEHRQAMDWYSNAITKESIPSSQVVQLEEQLREAIMQMQGQNRRDSRELTMILMGKEIKRVDLLWQTYRLLAESMQWGIDFHLLLNYDPFRDEKSEAYRKRVSRNQVVQPLHDGLDLPVLRLLGPVDENQIAPKWIDVHRIPEPKSLEEIPHSALGIALRFRGEGVASWLGEEEGIHHFVSDSRGVPSKRWRFRLDVTNKPLAVWELPPQWKETPTIPDRDPRRTYHFAYQTITDPFAEGTLTLESGNEAKQLVDWIQEQHKMAVWRSIGFVRPEPNVRYGAVENTNDFQLEAIPY